MFDLKTTIINLELQNNKRIIAISDIHGCRSYLSGVLKKAEFCDEDYLFIVGDIIEKGPDSLGTLRDVMRLCQGGNVFAVIGNVDAFRLRVLNELDDELAVEFFEYILQLRQWAGSSFYDEMAHECGFEINSARDIMDSKNEILSHFEKELNFLNTLPTVIETQNFIFVHGGLRDRSVPDNSLRSVFELTKYDAFNEKTPHTFDKYVVVGHWPVPLYGTSIQQFNPVINNDKRIISIDGGCGIKTECQLNALIIPSIGCNIEEIKCVSYDELPTVTATEDQTSSSDSIYISWADRKIEIIDKRDEFSVIKHVSSGKTIEIPNSYLKNNEECRDYTDYALPVKKGDELSLIAKSSKGIIAKRNGIVGWYYGKYI